MIFLNRSVVSELPSKQLGEINRKDLFTSLNQVYRHNAVSFESFNDLCDKLNDHVWLIVLAMQNDWIFEDVREATHRPEGITQMLWKKLQVIIRKLSIQDRILLCVFGIVNPISEKDLRHHLNTVSSFSKKDALDSSLLSLRKKLLLTYDSQTRTYEVNPFLREVSYTYFRLQKEMQTVENIPFFNHVPKPKYNNILQAHAKGDYSTFYKLLRDKRRNREFDLVLDILREIISIDPKVVMIYNEIGITYKLQKKYDEAIEAFESALKVDKENVPTYNELAIIYKLKKNYPKAIEVLQSAIKINPNDIKALNELAIVYRLQKNYTKAIEILEPLVEKENHIPSYNELAIVYKEKGNYLKAIDVLERSQKLNPNDFKTKNELGIVHKMQGNDAIAIALFSDLIKDFKHIPAYNELATIYSEKGMKDKAVEIVNQGLKVAPYDHLLKLTLSKINLRQSHNNNTILSRTNITISSLKSFLGSNLRRAVLKEPQNEINIQDIVEQLLIGKELRKGIDYDREVGRIKVSIKEFKPDFVFINQKLALEIKLSKTKAKSKEIVDEINADIHAYSKEYTSILFLLYDLGTIRDEAEFKNGIDNGENIQVIIVKQ